VGRRGDKCVEHAAIGRHQIDDRGVAVAQEGTWHLGAVVAHEKRMPELHHGGEARHRLQMHMAVDQPRDEVAPRCIDDHRVLPRLGWKLFGDRRDTVAFDQHIQLAPVICALGRNDGGADDPGARLGGHGSTVRRQQQRDPDGRGAACPARRAQQRSSALDSDQVTPRDGHALSSLPLDVWRCRRR
jgi:hypothetical protein